MNDELTPKIQLAIYHYREFKKVFDEIQGEMPNHLRAFMYKSGLKGYELAKQLDIIPEYLSPILSGKRKISIEILEKFRAISKGQE